MADDDNFDIDIYGDDGPPEGNEEQENVSGSVGLQTQDGTQAGDEMMAHDEGQHTVNHTSIESQETSQGPQNPSGPTSANANAQAPLDSDATSALVISEMQWWTNDDDIRGWANKCSHEHDLKDITFAEYKINGKSRGSAYVEFTSAKAASAVKHLLNPDNHKGEKKTSSQPFNKPVTASYAQPNSNPFLATAKDGPNRQNNTTPTNTHNNNAANQSFRGGGHQGNFRGRGMGSRGNHNFRGGGGGMGFQSGGGAGQMNGGFNNGQIGGGFGGPMNNTGGGFGGGFGNRGAGNMSMTGGNMRGGGGPARGRGGAGGNMNMMGANVPMGMGGGMQMQNGMPMGPMGNMGLGMMGESELNAVFDRFTLTGLDLYPVPAWSPFTGLGSFADQFNEYPFEAREFPMMGVRMSGAPDPAGNYNQSDPMDGGNSVMREHHFSNKRQRVQRIGQTGNFNPNFFQGNHQQGTMRGNSGSSGGGDNWNPHGAKRMRPD
ncbi:MAG: hypothetical protein M1831_000626 [Alyxoria varia]|nr:MAG: hypothetical protein M1831_000626 [Alyxoria varia]